MNSSGCISKVNSISLNISNNLTKEQIDGLWLFTIALRHFQQLAWEILIPEAI